MLHFRKLPSVLCALLSMAAMAQDAIIVECEQFSDKGGWAVDSQFIDEMGSSYLLAHGLGKPVADATTCVDVAKKGIYNVFVRTKNWTAPWSDSPAGVFLISLDDRELPESLGTQGNGSWIWQKAGAVELSAGRHKLALKDKTGFDGRSDAICLTLQDAPPSDRGWSMAEKEDETIKADLVVCGAGVAGICTAISAARLGLKVALATDRPVLGGANSSEVRVHLGGRLHFGKYPRLGDVVSEIGPAKGGNAMSAARYEDDRKMNAVLAEKNIRLFLNTRIVAADADRGVIRSVTGRNTLDGRRTRFEAPLFADCTGDGAVGALAGADFRIGREGRGETGESLAPERADSMTMGASVQWNSRQEAGAEFPHKPWMLKFSEESCSYLKRGDWDWETGMNRDQLLNFEYVRDYGMLAVYSNWSFIKNSGKRRAKWANLALNWVAYVAGKRETRRLLGDHILTQQDIFENRPMSDGTCWATWSIDLHYPMPENALHFPEDPFRSICKHAVHSGYAIPYRCFYSRNINNLFMAGRNISVTHVALGTVRVMRTTGMMGEVVGMAASVCRRHNCTPREVYRSHLEELKNLMKKGVGRGSPQPPQNYNLGSIKKVSASSAPDGDKIAAKCKVVSRDKMLGFERIRFEFEDCIAWVVEPAKPAAGSPWVWCMEWPSAFQRNTGVRELLSAGYRWVTFNPAYARNRKPHAGNQNDAMIAKRNRFQKFLVSELGLEPKCCLVGMSWGGFYSVRYASEHPECVKAMYLDAPLLDFSTLSSFRKSGWKYLKEFYPQITQDYVGANDPMQSVSAARAERIAKAKIPVLLIYGAADTVVPAESNCLRFADAFEKAGGHLKLWRDNHRGHHPHGLAPGEGVVFVNFFNKAE